MRRGCLCETGVRCKEGGGACVRRGVCVRDVRVRSYM